MKKKILDYHHTGLYVALENGYYKEEGLDVKIIEPAEGSTPVLVATGKGDLSSSYKEKNIKIPNIKIGRKSFTKTNFKI